MSNFGFGKSSNTTQKLQLRWSDLDIHGEVQSLITSGVQKNLIQLRSMPADEGWRTTVMIDLVSHLNPISGKKYYPGHAGLILWHIAGKNAKYYSVGIVTDGTLDPEDVKSKDLQTSTRLNLWFFTKKVKKNDIEKMINRITTLSNSKLTYDEFLGSRYFDSYNCHTIVDDILNAGGLSGWTGRPWSWLTPWVYSLSFGVTGWHSSVMYNTKNI